MSIFSTLNAGLTLEPSRRFPYSLGVAILITVKFHMFPSAIYCHLISTRIRETWDIRLPGHTLELRGSDYLGETVQIDEELSIGEALEAWFPRWRTFQQTSFHPELLPLCPRRLVWRASCHRKVPGVILP